MTATARARIGTAVVALAATALAIATPGWATATTSTPTATRMATPVLGRLLPVPAVPPGTILSVTAVDANPRGVVAGTAQLRTTAPNGTPSIASTPQRWARVPGLGWRRQQLALPAAAESGTVVGLTDLGEGGGTVVTGGV